MAPSPQHPSELGGAAARLYCMPQSFLGSHQGLPAPALCFGNPPTLATPPALPWPRAALFSHFIDRQTEAPVWGDGGTFRSGLSECFPETGAFFFSSHVAFSCFFYSLILEDLHPSSFPLQQWLFSQWSWRTFQSGFVWSHP